jgi:2-polyprenyl-6-methoxyphenol hydroxylase-like FAD-dependent oxidoreductase
MAGDEHFDVVIIGAGPAGLVLAIALAHYKIKVRCKYLETTEQAADEDDRL